MTDRTRSFIASVQSLMAQHRVNALRSVSEAGGSTFWMLFAETLNDIEVMHVWNDAGVFGPQGELTLNNAQRSFISALQSLMSQKSARAIQATAVSAANQGFAFLLDMNSDADSVELAEITQDQIQERGQSREGEAVLATWTMKTGPAKGQPTRTQQWIYTQADHDADIAGAGDPGGEVPDFVTPMTPPHNIFTRRQWDAWYMAFMQPNPGSVNWVQLEFVWTGGNS